MTVSLLIFAECRVPSDGGYFRVQGTVGESLLRSISRSGGKYDSFSAFEEVCANVGFCQVRGIFITMLLLNTFLTFNEPTRCKWDLIVGYGEGENSKYRGLRNIYQYVQGVFLACDAFKVV